MFETQLEEFCDSKGISQADFMIRCREASTDDTKAKHYISILLSSVEYDTFVKLMKIMRPVAERRLASAALAAAATAKAEAKSDPSDAKAGAAEGGDANSSSTADAQSSLDGKSVDPGSSAKASAKGGEDEADGPADAKSDAKAALDEDSKGAK